MNQQRQEFEVPPGVGAVPDNPWIGLARGKSFLMTDETRGLADRALLYLQAGVPVHLRGMAGLGKTSLALTLAEALGRPISFMTGNEWLTGTDLVGREIGQSTVTVVDKYIQSVRRTETASRADWQDSVLATAMERGHTLVYDEFTRASPEANAALLSVLEEGVLVSPDPASGRSLVRAHAAFRVILTSNPHDYVGVNSAPDALLDRVLTLTVAEPATPALAAIVAMRCGLDRKTADRIVGLVVRVRQEADSPGLASMRTCLLIGRIVAHETRRRALTPDRLSEIASDVFAGRGVALTTAEILRLLSPQPES